MLVWVADCQIDSYNMADILGDGTASYDPATNTMTLNGYQNGEFYATMPLNILLLGENRIETAGDALDFDISGGENVTMTIGGSVTVNLMSGYGGISLVADTPVLVIKDSATVIAGTEAAPLTMTEGFYIYGEYSGSVTITGSATVSATIGG